MGANSEDELNDIINQLDKLQKEIESTEPNQATQTKSPPDLKIVSSTALPLDSEQDDNDMQDFRGGATDEASLEDTLSQLEQTEPAADSLLAQVSEIDESVEEPVDSGVEEDAESAIEATEDVSVAAEVESVHNFDEVVQEESMANKDAQSGSLTMTLTGNLTLKLRYEYEGQEVTVGFEDQCLKVELADGTEFKIPVARKGKAFKSVA